MDYSFPEPQQRSDSDRSVARAICPLPHTYPYRSPRLASIAMIGKVRVRANPITHTQRA